MRSTRHVLHVPHVRHVLVFVATCATAACTSLLGSYDVGGDQQQGGPDGSGPTSEGGQTTEAGAGDTSVPTDAPSDSAPTCAAPKTVCGTSCVNLTFDADNCGACGHGCLGGFCSARSCQPALAYPRTDVVAKTLVATDTDLFFDTTSHQVFQQPVAAGGAAIKLATATGGVFDIAVVAPRVYFTALNSDGLTWDVWLASIGMAASGVAGGGMYGGTPVGLVVAGGNVHTANTLSGGPATFRITSCSLTAGSGCVANFTGPGVPGSRMAAGAGSIFWTDQASGAVYAMPDAIGLRTTIGGTEGTATAASWDGASLFWVQNNTGKLRRSPYPSPAPADVRDLTSSADDLVVDGTNVYYAQYDGMTEQIYALAKGGASAPVKIASGRASRLAQTPTGIYWAEADGIHVIRKP